MFLSGVNIHDFLLYRGLNLDEDIKIAVNWIA